ncbi:MAG: DUF998 domain-containing protein [Promethearchaeota archaeon]|nr:MAG: DUF998 domain-containing protein [Candidatus Lokiarchaeota archaeon]
MASIFMPNYYKNSIFYSLFFCINISDIGAGPLEVKIIFGIGMILAAIFLMLLFTYIADFLRKNSIENIIVQTYLIRGIIAEIGLIFIGLFPMDPVLSFAFEIHRIAAIIFFGFTAINSFIFSYLQFKNSEFSMILSVISLITAAFSAEFAIGFAIQEYILLDRVAFIVLSEWGFFGFVSIWLIVHALFFRRIA